MKSEQANIPRWEFPDIPESLRVKYGVGKLFLRPFGLQEVDLDFDFNQRCRPLLVTRLLQSCAVSGNGDRLSEEFFWDLTVGKRIEALLTLALRGGESAVPVQLRCLKAECGQCMEITLTLQELRQLPAHPDDSGPVTVHLQDETLELLKPTGRDQLAWLNRAFPSEDEAIQTMIATLVQTAGTASLPGGSLLSAEWLTAIDASMRAGDPLIEFAPRVSCPYCNEENHFPIDLEGLALRQSQQAQLRLLQTIHRLAGHYHWSESEVLAIPPWRRNHYLALIETEEAR